MATLNNNSIQSHLRTSGIYGNGFNDQVSFRTSDGVTNAHYCKTHVNFTHEGNSNNDILTGVGSFNAGSITELGVGLYQCNFTNPFHIISYGVVAVAQHSRNSGDGNRIYFQLRDKQTTHIVLEVTDGAGNNGYFRIMDAAFAIFTAQTNIN